MNQFQRKLKEIAAIRESLGQEAFDRNVARFIMLTKELDIELDGVSIPGSAASIIDSLRSVNGEMKS